MTGPNARPTMWVPQRCAANRTVTIPKPSGSAMWARSGAATSRPSVADSTEIAGVIRLSP